MLCLWFFFFKQKTADEMRISDWSSDVCSSDLWSNNTIIECIAASAFRIAGKLGCRAYARQILRVDELGKLIFGDRRMWRQTIDLQQLGRADNLACAKLHVRSEEHTSELQSLMRISYAVFCLKKKKKTKATQN